MRIRSKLLIGAMLLEGVAGTAAFAQDGIEVVTVTAAKREQNVQDVPISMNVFSAAKLADMGISDIEGLARVAPNLVVNRGQTTNSIYLRGFGSGSQNPAIDQTVALYQDGIFAGRPREYMAPFFDVERIEILRGPQGALLGKNTAAGAVSITTRSPTDEFEAGVTASYLIDRKGVDVEGYLSGPISDDLSARAAMKFVKTSEGWIDNTLMNRSEPTTDSIQGRIGLTFQPSEGIKNTLKIQYDRVFNTGRAAAPAPTTITTPAAFRTTKATAGVLGVADDDRENVWHFMNQLEADVFGNLTLVSLSGFTAYTAESNTGANHSNPEQFTTKYMDSWRQGSQEFRLLSPADQTLSWIVGVYADYSDFTVDNRIRYVAPVNGQMTSYFKQHGSTYSAYATVTWNITDDARLIGGARWTRVNKSGSYTLANDFGANFLGVAPPIPRTFTGSFGEDHFDPSITAQYDLSDDIMVYAGWSKGSKGGTFQGANRAVTAATFALQPEKSTNWEVGAKTQWGDWLTFNIAAFHLTFKNLQSGQYVGGVLLTKNVGEALSQGFEMTSTIRPFDGFTIDMSASYTDAHYVDYPGAPCTFAQLPPLGTCVNGVTATNGAGRRLGFVSPWSGEASATYTTPVFSGLKVSGTLGIEFKSNYLLDPTTYNPNWGYNPSLAKINFQVSLAEEEDMWKLAVIGKNMTDEIASAGVYTWPFTAPPVNVFTILEGRSVQIQGSLKL